VDAAERVGVASDKRARVNGDPTSGIQSKVESSHSLYHLTFCEGNHIHIVPASSILLFSGERSKSAKRVRNKVMDFRLTAGKGYFSQVTQINPCRNRSFVGVLFGAI
jgi:hypothetical protein